MQKYLYRIFLVFGIVQLVWSSHARTNFANPAKTDRQPAVAGSFYPAGKSELLKLLADYFNKALSRLNQSPLAIIVPHAGYIFSGNVAAAGFRQINRDAVFKHVFIIGSSHTTMFDGASVYSSGDFITPLGRVAVDTLAGWLDKQYKFITNDIQPHIREHSIEVQLPFLQYWLKNPFTIVPLIVGGESPKTCSQLASALKPFLTGENLFIISTDFSHYPGYSDANLSDSIMAGAVLSNSSKAFLKAKQTQESGGIPNLVTAMCGWSSVLTLLDMTENNPDYAFQKLFHKNSGDSQYGEKDRVVGYYSIALVKKKEGDSPGFYLTDEDKTALLRIARNTIQQYISNRTVPWMDKNQLSPNLLVPAGAFVTLSEYGSLRGCIGSFQATEPLYRIVQSMAVAASTQDPRFDPVNPSDIDRLKIEISVLTPMKKIKSIDEIELGKHGIYIKKGSRSGTFLPQVATDTRWTKEEFLGHCAQDKADIGWNGWKDAEIYIYEALVFGEETRRK